jgi:molybdate-binding protein
MSGRADVGMAIYASARALRLHFIPVAEERYDLIIPDACWEDAKIRLVLDIIVSAPFKRMVGDMGGYDVGEAGKVMGHWDGQRWL